jgi:hypothetical protein
MSLEDFNTNIWPPIEDLQDNAAPNRNLSITEE